MRISGKLAAATCLTIFNLGCMAQLPGPELTSTMTGFSDLEAEYAPFTTQALTQPYLGRKIRRWSTTNNGAAMQREIEFARHKHPHTLRDLMWADHPLYVSTAAMSEVNTYRSQNTQFDAYMVLLSGVPAAPTAQAATSVTTSGFTGSWAAVAGASSYEVRVNNEAPISAGTALTYAFTGLAQNTSFTYQVRGVNGNGPGPWSNEVTQTTNLKTLVTGITPWQTFTGTLGAYEWETYTINGDTFLAAPDYHDNTSFNLNTRIYKWNATTQKFDPHQTFASTGFLSSTHFQIGNDHYVAFASHHGSSGYNTISKIYKFNPVNKQLVEHQTFNTYGALNWQHMNIAGEDYLVVSNYASTSGQTANFNINSVVYKFNPVSGNFQPHHNLLTMGALHFESFKIGAEQYLAVANYFTGSSYSTDSKIYKWNGTQFDPIQSIATVGARDMEAFQIGSDTYLAVANFYGTPGGYQQNSIIYKWDGTKFNPFQTMLTNGNGGWDHFQLGQQHYLIRSSYHNNTNQTGNTVIYRWNSVNSSFESIIGVANEGAYFPMHFAIGMDHFMAIPKHYYGTYVYNSIIYKMTLE